MEERGAGSLVRSGIGWGVVVRMVSSFFWGGERGVVPISFRTFSVAITTPLLALIPRDVPPPFTAARAFSSCPSLPLGLNVVRENEYCKEREGSALEVSRGHDGSFMRY